MKRSFLLFVFSQMVLSLVCRAKIRLQNLTSGHVIRELQDYSTGLGPPFPFNGLRGRHRYLNVSDPCSPDLPQPPQVVDSRWFALLEFKEECYQNQILNIQLAGYLAAILSKDFEDDEDDEGESIANEKRGGERTLALRTRSGNNDNINALERNDTLHIPSTVVSNSTKIVLIAFSDKPNITMMILPDYHDMNKFMLILLGTLCLAVVTALFLTGVMYGCYRVYKVRKSIVTKWKLKLLPTHIFQKGDSYEVCVICLDEYVEGAKLRILSCGHAFHCKCVDPWLVKSGRECPLCKRKADLGRSRAKRSRGDDYGEGADSSAEERAALLGDESRDNFDEDDDDNPVRILPEGQTTINAIVHSSEHQDPNTQRLSSGHRNYGAMGAARPHNENSQIPEVVMRGGSHGGPFTTPPNLTDGGQNRLMVTQPLAACPPGEQSRARFYIGSVTMDDGCLLNMPEGTHQTSEKEAIPAHPKVDSEGEDSEEDFYDVV